MFCHKPLDLIMIDLGIYLTCSTKVSRYLASCIRQIHLFISHWDKLHLCMGTGQYCNVGYKKPSCKKGLELVKYALMREEQLEPFDFQAEVHARIQEYWWKYCKVDGNFRHVWLRKLTNEDGNFCHVW